MELTVRLMVVVAAEDVEPTGLPVTLKLYKPGVTEDATLIAKRLGAPDKVGVTGLTVKLPQVIPAGRLLLTQDNVTVWAEPAINFAVTVAVPELPAVILTGPLFDNE